MSNKSNGYDFGRNYGGEAQFYQAIWGPYVRSLDKKKSEQALSELKQIISSMSPDELREFKKLLKQEYGDDILPDDEDDGEPEQKSLKDRSPEEIEREYEELRWKSDVFSDNLYRRLRARSTANKLIADAKQKAEQAAEQAKLAAMTPEERVRHEEYQKELNAYNNRGFIVGVIGFAAGLLVTSQPIVGFIGAIVFYMCYEALSTHPEP